jgi:hypothetical protein
LGYLHVDQPLEALNNQILCHVPSSQLASFYYKNLMPLLIQPFIIKGMDLLYCSLPLLKTYTIDKENLCQTFCIKASIS